MQHVCVVDLAYGDSGKGALVDRLCATGDYSLVVRYNGGCQAAHNVVTDDGQHHTFAQFGSGTLKGVNTVLSSYMIVEPLSFMVEAEALKKLGVSDPFATINVSEDCLVTTPFHWLLNRWREDRRGNARHGSCGRGVGATKEYALTVAPGNVLRISDLRQSYAYEKLDWIRNWVIEQSQGGLDLPTTNEVYLRYADFNRYVRRCWDWDIPHLADYGRIVFEGAQGVLLDEDYGFHPHTTWSYTTTRNAARLAEAWNHELEVIGVVRAYSTRHGAGPFVPEDNSLRVPESHNKREHYQGDWRVGHFDTPAVRYANAATGVVDSLYVTHVDTAHAEPNLLMCEGYYDDNDEAIEPLLLDPNDFEAREQQTARLASAKPALMSRLASRWEVAISQALDIPLCGFAHGPKTSEGHFTPASVG